MNDQQNLTAFGGGVKPDRDDKDTAHESRTERAKYRRRLYEYGRCRAISTSKGTRCGAGVDPDGRHSLCNYHKHEHQPVVIDGPPGLLARWCGQRMTMWEDIPEPCREALLAIDDGEDGSTRTRA